MARFGYDPIYYDTPASLQISNTNYQPVMDYSTDPDWIDPAEYDVYGNPLIMQTPTPTVADYNTPGRLPDFSYTLPPRPAPPSPTPTPSYPPSSYYYVDPRAYQYERMQQMENDRRLMAMRQLQIPVRRNDAMQDYMRQLALREATLRQKEEPGLREKLMRDYIDRLLRAQGAPF